MWYSGQDEEKVQVEKPGVVTIPTLKVPSDAAINDENIDRTKSANMKPEQVLLNPVILLSESTSKLPKVSF